MSITISYQIFRATSSHTRPQRHAELFAKDVPPSKVVRIIDRYLAYYIMTADKLQRTARWIENMEGGIEVDQSTFLQSSMLIGMLETPQGDPGGPARNMQRT